ncbi:MAG: hypothetical protein ACOVRN_07440 [Flavobacterium sp.]
MSNLFACCVTSSTSQVVTPMYADESPIKPLEILLVHKNRPTLKLIECTLRNAGHKVTTTNKGNEALRLIQEKWATDNSIFQVILFDLNMPCEDMMYYTNQIKHELEDTFKSNGLALPSQFIVGITNTIKRELEHEYDKLLEIPFSIYHFNTLIRRSKNQIHYITRFQIV